MIFKYHIPFPPLNHFVECIIYHSGYSPAHAREKLLPDGMVNLIIDLTEIPKNLYDNDNPSQKTAFRRGWLSGIHQEYLTIDAGQNSAMLVASFKPGKLRSLSIISTIFCCDAASLATNWAEPSPWEPTPLPP